MFLSLYSLIVTDSRLDARFFIQNLRWNRHPSGYILYKRKKRYNNNSDMSQIMNQDEAIQRAMEEILNDMSQEIQEEIRTGRHHYPTMKERRKILKNLWKH